MRIRAFLLIGPAFPLAIGAPTFSAAQTESAPVEVAAEPCPEGQTCPPPAKQQQKKQKKQKQEGQQGGAQGQQDGQQSGQGAGKKDKKGVAQRQKQGDQGQQDGAQGQQEGQQGGAEGQQSGQGADQQNKADEQKKKGGAKREKKGQQGQQGGDQGQQGGEQQGTGQQGGQEGTGQQQGQQNSDQNQQQQRQNQGGQSDQQGGQQGQENPPRDEQSTAEQQLDAQGDQEEAKKVRSLRQRLQQQLQGAGVDQGRQGADNQGGKRDGQSGGSEGRNRDRANGDPGGWWERDHGRDVVDRRGGRIIIDLGNGRISVEAVAPDEGGRLLFGARDVEVQNLPRGRVRTVVHRGNGVDIVTVRDRNGDIIRRSKILPGGVEIVLIANRFPDDYGEHAPPPPPILYDVPRVVVGIPRNRYIVDYGSASDEDIRGALLAPTVQQIQRPYTLDEVLYNQDVRDYAPRIDLDTITFETGSATISGDQMHSLEALGHAMQQVITDSPDEVYLIEGHTDAVGDPDDNLILSDERAEAVATALSQNFDIPPENLVTKGYGEEFLKVDTDGPELQNRRATVRRLTELLQAQNQ